MARIVVVGAGMAGLTAALRLTQARHDVTAHEARDESSSTPYRQCPSLPRL